ncbi:FadR/GntR family transcriptional regulator [Tessaracoccus sp. G1721]
MAGQQRQGAAGALVGGHEAAEADVVAGGVLDAGDHAVRAEASGLDQTLAPSVVERMNAAAAEELGQLCDAMAAHSSRDEAFAAEDRAFHLTLASLLDNELYEDLVGAFWDVHTRLAPRLGVPTPRDISDTVDAHRAMLDAAVTGDLEAYRAAVENHYAPLLRVLDSAPA